MRRLLCCPLLAILLFAGCHRGQIRVQRAPGAEGYVWRSPISQQEFDAYWKDLLFEVTPQVGYAAGRQEEVEGFILNAQLRWNDAVRPLAGMFRDLREQHNQALIALSEFEKRKSRLADATTALKAQKGRLESALADYRAAREEADHWRGAEGPEAAREVAKARTRIGTVAADVEQIIRDAVALVDGLKDPRVEAMVMARD